MKMGTLKIWRKIIPAMLCVVGYGVFGTITDLWDFPDIDIKNAGFSPLIIPIAFLYYIFGIQEKANSIWFAEVTENLRSKLVEVSGLADDPAILNWKEVKKVFYHLVDNDESLKVQANLAYDNGLMWTSAADTMIVSFIWMLISVMSSVMGVSNSETAILFFLVITLFAIFASIILTNKHKKIGDNQINIIKFLHKEKLKEGLERVVENASS